MKETLLMAAMRCQQVKQNGVITITGKTGSGKSLLAMKAALYSLGQYSKVLYISDELTEEVIDKKMGLIYEALDGIGRGISRGIVYTENIPHTTDVLASASARIQSVNPDFVVLDLVTAQQLPEFAQGLVAAGKTVVITQTAKHK